MIDDIEMRERVSVLLKNLATELRMSSARLPALSPVRPFREWKSTPITELDASNPLPQLSPELRAKLGLRAMEAATK